MEKKATKITLSLFHVANFSWAGVCPECGWYTQCDSIGEN